MKKYHITGITWQTDTETVSLPNEVVVKAENEDCAIDELSNQFGFLVESVESIEETDKLNMYSVKIYYRTYVYEEVVAESPEEAKEKAQDKIDAYDDEAYNAEVVSNLSYDEAEVCDQYDGNSVFI
jgi:hypothetical protein